MLPGQQRRLLTPGKNEKFYLAGALDVFSGRIIATGTPKKNAGLFCSLLDEVVKALPQARRIHLIVDNYSIHHARATERHLAKLGGRVVLHFLPLYCADANRIERCWLDLHANVTRNHRHRTMLKLLEAAKTYIDDYRWSRASKPVPARMKLAA